MKKRRMQFSVAASTASRGSGRIPVISSRMQSLSCVFSNCGPLIHPARRCCLASVLLIFISVGAFSQQAPAKKGSSASPNSGKGDIGVQVTHQVTTQVPFDGTCNPPDCVETTLSDGSVLRTDRVDPGGGMILTAEVHRPDGVIVQAQESNYGFGPNAPVKQYGDQPLTLDQLTALAEDQAFTF